MKQENKKIVFLRFIAILIVVLGHSIIIYDNNWGIYKTTNNSYFFFYLKQLINIIQMPLWFSISGFLFYNSINNRKIQPKEFIKNKFKRLIVPYLLIGILWLLPIRYIVGYENYLNNNLFYNIFVNIILGFDNGHLWYLSALFLIFVIMIFLNKKVNLNKNSKKNDFIYLICLVILHFIGRLFPLFIGNSLIYLIYFYIGFIVNKYNTKCININRYLLITLLTLCIYVVVKINLCIYIKLLLDLFFSILILFEIYNINIGFENNKIIKNISNLSYGIYLLHSPLVYISYSFFPNIEPSLMFVINFIVFGLISVILTKCVKKSKAKIIFGEV